MYQIYADNELIYDSTYEDYKIDKGSISLETNKSGSFTFSIYPDHFYYDRFIKLKTVIKVLRSNKIIFRGRILNDVTDYWNNKVITCEGELGFLQDSIIRPFTFNGTPIALFTKFINEHNSQVDDFKKFKIGSVTVVDPNDYIARSNEAYDTALANLNSRLIDDSLGGYFYITHGEDGTEEIPTINYLADFTKVSSQVVEFGSNLKDYTKTVKAEEIATAIIPIGATINNDTGEKLTISSVNDGKDFIYNESAVSLYGWIFKSVVWDDVNVASNLISKGRAYLDSIINQNITIELNAIDLHLLDRSIDSFSVGDYIRVVSAPHNFDATLLCNKQTIDLLKPENDSLTLGYTYSTFTETTSKTANVAQVVSSIRSSVNAIGNSYVQVTGDIEAIAQSVVNINKDVQALGLVMYPVGSIYMSVNNVNPANHFGGTWVPWGSGRVPVGVSSSDGDFNTVEKTGGSKEMQKHQHAGLRWGSGGSNPVGLNSGGNANIRLSFESASAVDYFYTGESGSGDSGNLQPYITCYMWKRVA